MTKKVEMLAIEVVCSVLAGVGLFYLIGIVCLEMNCLTSEAYRIAKVAGGIYGFINPFVLKIYRRI